MNFLIRFSVIFQQNASRNLQDAWKSSGKFDKSLRSTEFCETSGENRQTFRPRKLCRKKQRTKRLFEQSNKHVELKEKGSTSYWYPRCPSFGKLFGRENSTKKSQKQRKRRGHRSTKVSATRQVPDLQPAGGPPRGLTFEA